MTDSGLSARLRQQSRRAGLMVGITMVLVIAICIFGAAALYAALSRPFSDLIPMAAPAAQIPSAPTPMTPRDETPAALTNEAEAVAPVAEVVPTEPPIVEAFAPTYQIGANSSVNFRSGPSTNDRIIRALSPAEPLQYLDEDLEAPNGDRWMKFRAGDGDEGWVLEVFTEQYQP